MKGRGRGELGGRSPLLLFWRSCRVVPLHSWAGGSSLMARVTSAYSWALLAGSVTITYRNQLTRSAQNKSCPYLNTWLNFIISGVFLWWHHSSEEWRVCGWKISDLVKRILIMVRGSGIQKKRKKCVKYQRSKIKGPRS